MKQHLHQEITLPLDANIFYAVVQDVVSYKKFLPFCTFSSYTSVSDTTGIGCIEIKKGVFNVSIATFNTYNQENGCIQMTLQKGPFKHLEGGWIIYQKSLECTIQFNLTFELKNILLNQTAKPILSQISTIQMNAFIKKTTQLMHAKKHLL